MNGARHVAPASRRLYLHPRRHAGGRPALHGSHALPAQTPRDRAWIDEAVRRIEADFNRSSDTHLLRLPLPALADVHLYLKDESTHPTGSLKHRLARSLLLHALCNGWIGPTTVLIEASSGSTAVSEAYFARLLGLRFIAVMPRGTSEEKIAAIAHYGGESAFVDQPMAMYDEARRLAADLNGHFLDQFTYAERATDWRGNNNIAQSIFAQMRDEPHPTPAWIVIGAGTGGTSATIGRYVRYRRLPTRLALADPEASVFHRHWADPAVTRGPDARSLIEGVGRPRVEPSFNPALIDRAVTAADAEAIGAARALTRHLGRSCGGSTGLNLIAAAQIAAEMAAAGEAGSIVTLLCDSGERYRSTLFNDAWLAGQGLDVAPAEAKMAGFLQRGVWAA